MRKCMTTLLETYPDLDGFGITQGEHMSGNKADEAALRGKIEKHLRYTGSARARQILENWSTYLPKFVKVMPTDYRRALLEIAAQQKEAA